MSLFSNLSNISRIKKMEYFYSYFQPDEKTLILDLGAQINPDHDTELQLIDNYTWKNNITAINTFPEHIEKIKKTYPDVNAIIADACDLPWPDKYFDIIYSNAVIEHVGDKEKQKKMAAEIMRVGKKWFITTPNRWFPFEFHLRLPVVSWLPYKIMNKIGYLYSYNHVEKKYKHGMINENVRLLSARELKKMFPDSKIIKQRITFMSETLIAVTKKN